MVHRNPRTRALFSLDRKIKLCDILVVGSTSIILAINNISLQNLPLIYVVVTFFFGEFLFIFLLYYYYSSFHSLGIFIVWEASSVVKGSYFVLEEQSILKLYFLSRSISKVWESSKRLQKFEFFDYLSVCVSIYSRYKYCLVLFVIASVYVFHDENLPF